MTPFATRSWVVALCLTLLGAGCLDRALNVETNGGGGSNDGSDTSDTRSSSEDDGNSRDAAEVGGPGSSEDSGVVECRDPEDCDDDGIPDRRDPMPRDPGLPGQARSDVMYANTSSALYTVDFDGFVPTMVAEFSFDRERASVTDIAIGKFGVMYAVTSSAIFACDPTDARCFFLTAAEDLNAAGFVPNPGGAELDDTLYAASAFGAWNRINLDGATVTVERLGDYDGAVSAGDIDGGPGLAVASVKRDGVPALAVVDPENGRILDEIAPRTISEAWGLVQLEQALVLFGPDGTIFDFPSIQVLSDSELSWWGAALHPANTR